MKRKIIIGIQLGHNSSVSLIINGQIVGALSEEKFNNVKNSSVFPLNSIKYLLKKNSVEYGEIDAVVHGGIYCVPNTMSLIQKEIKTTTINSKFLDKLDYNIGKITFIKNLTHELRLMHFKRISKDGKKKLYSLLEKEFKISKEKVHFVNHHIAHTYSSYYSLRQNNNNALVITMDGSGDNEFATISIVKNDIITKVSESSWINSIGYVYSQTTQFLGMKALEHEYKVMGLAPYAKDYYKETYNKILKDIISFNPKSLVFNSKFPLNKFNVHLEKYALYERFDNIAAALQYFTEENVTKWVRAAVKKYKIDEVYFGGGVFMNVKLNKKIMEMPEVKHAYFLGSCGDESNAIGAAYYQYKTSFPDEELKPLENFYLGMDFTNKEIELFIKKNKLDKKYQVTFHEDIEKKTAELLARGKIVARFKGKSEWGARSLGNRSILADPSKMESFYTVNDQIKMRDFWMPFAPSILHEDQDKYIINPKKYKAPYMILGFDSTKLGQDKLRAAMHQADKTLRAQIVEKEVNSEYHKLISYFKELSGIGGVMNTSMNLHGYPLVATPEQAMFTFENSGLEYLSLENYLIEKKN